MIGSKIIRELRTQPIAPENFRPYGQVIFSSQDETAFGANDPQLILDRGTPRFYIMSFVENLELKFSKLWLISILLSERKI